MIESYSETNIFSDGEIQKYMLAAMLVGGLDHNFNDMRCHELARAVGKFINLPHQDGRFEGVEHTWLWTREIKPKELSFMYKSGGSGLNPPHVIDVYVPGCLPMIQMVDLGAWQLPYKRAYRVGKPRDDIRENVITRLLTAFEQMKEP